MENLTKPTQRILINSSADLAKVKLYQDSIAKKKILSFVPFGVQLPGDGASYTNGVLSQPVASGVANSNLGVTLETYDAGVFQAEEVTVNTSLPCFNDCAYEPHVEFIKRVEKPRQNNNENNFRNKRSYTASVDTSLAANFTSGLLTTAAVEEIVNDIVVNCQKDAGFFNENNDLITNNAAAYVEARKAYHWSNSSWGSAELYISCTLADGTVVFTNTTIADGATAKATAEVINGTATVKSYVAAFAVSATEVVIMSLVNGAKVTCTIKTASTSTLTAPSIIFLSRSVDVQWQLVCDNGEFTKTKFTLAQLSAYTSAGTTTITTNLGVSSASNDNSSAVTTSANLNTAVGSAGYVATGGNAVVYVYANSTVTTMKFLFSSASTTVVDVRYSSFPMWAKLTYRQVRDLFVNATHSGALVNYEDQILPVAGTEYCKFTLTVNNMPEFSMHGASASLYVSNSIELFIPKSLLMTSLFGKGTGVNKYNGGSGSADTSLLTLLGIWFGNDVAENIQDVVAEDVVADTVTIVFNTSAVSTTGSFDFTINGITTSTVLTDSDTADAAGANIETALDAAGYTATYTAGSNTLVVVSPNTINSYSSVITTSTGFEILTEALS